MNNNNNTTLKERITNLAGDKFIEKIFEEHRSKNGVQLRRPQHTYKKVLFANDLRAEFFNILAENLSNTETINLPIWLAQRISWFYTQTFSDKLGQELGNIVDLTQNLIEKEAILNYILKNLTHIIREWLKFTLDERGTENLLCSFDKHLPNMSRVTFCEFGIKNKRRTMEDKIFTMENIEFNKRNSSLFALFDGHCGVECAEYVSKHLSYELVESYNEKNSELLNEEFFKSSFNKINKNFTQLALSQNIKSGCTACICLMQDFKRLYVAWCGDSQFCLVNKNGHVKYLTEPHKPNNPKEQERIERGGGTVTCCHGANTWRINSTLAVSRSFGDVVFQENDLVICEPDVNIIELDGSEDYFLIGCDGLFEHLDLEKDLVDVLGMMNRSDAIESENYVNSRSNCNLAELLVNRAKENGSSDNITCIYVKI
jgi:serine/threonine protein phosphatase PrpC